MSTTAYLLVAHGSKDPRPRQCLSQLGYILQQRLHGKYPQAIVGTTCLESISVPLHQSIQEFAQQVLRCEIRRVKVLPLFMLSGVHVQQDIPQEVAKAQEILGHSLHLQIQPHLGSYSGIATLLTHCFAKLNTTSNILIAHGSSVKQANQAIEKLAAQLSVDVAYWSIAPDLGTLVAKALEQSHSSIGIQPYFLFAGGITDAISQEVQKLQKENPLCSIILGEPLGMAPATIELILQILQEQHDQ